MLTDREIATLLLLAALSVLIIVWRKTHELLPQLLKSMFALRLSMVYALFFSYVALVLAVATWLRVWDVGLLKDTAIVTLTVALPLLAHSVTAPSGNAITKRALRDVLGVGAITAAYVNLASFNVAGELVLQVSVALISAVSVVAAHQGGDALRVARFLNVVLAIVGVGLLAYTTVRLIEDWATTDWARTGLAMAMSVWLPLALLPFLYFMAFYSATELIYVRLPYQAPVRRVPLGVRLGIFVRQNL